MSARSFEDAVVAVLTATRPGSVVTYGEVAEEAGFPGAARAVGNVLRRVGGLPWWRVVTATGRLVPGAEGEQARRLRGEGVVVRRGRVVAGERSRQRRSQSDPVDASSLAPDDVPHARVDRPQTRR